MCSDILGQDRLVKSIIINKHKTSQCISRTENNPFRAHKTPFNRIYIISKCSISGSINCEQIGPCCMRSKCNPNKQYNGHKAVCWLCLKAICWIMQQCIGFYTAQSMPLGPFRSVNNVPQTDGQKYTVVLENSSDVCCECFWTVQFFFT